MARNNKIFNAAMNIARRKAKPRIPVYSALGRMFGPTGKMFGALIDIFAIGGKVSEDDVDRAAEVMREAQLPLRPAALRRVDLRRWASQQGLDPDSDFRVDTIPDRRVRLIEPASPEELPPTKGDLPGPRGRSAIQDIDIDQARDATGNVRRVRQVGSPGSRRRQQGTVDPLYGDYTMSGLAGGEPAWSPEKGYHITTDPFEDEVFFGDSSNVYSAAYDEDKGILYVTYRAPGKEGTTGGSSICTGKYHEYDIRPNLRGPMYAYGSAANPVPKSLWAEIKSTQSAGKFVWDRLRVCGDFVGHQYRYTLVSPSMEGSLYIPRKAVVYRDPATNQDRVGYRVRAVPTVGLGRRPYLTSDGDYVS